MRRNWLQACKPPGLATGIALANDPPMNTAQPIVDATPVFGAAPAWPRVVTPMQRARGVARLGVRRVGAQSRLIENFQSGSAKLRFPRSEANEPFAAVLVNTAGGLTGGDRFSWSIDVQAEALATVASQAAERIYRRSAGHAQIETTLTVAEGAALEWLPQETILFDRSALRRTLTVDVTPSSRLLAVESIILGRTAMGESAKNIELTNSWRIRRGGRLIFADGLRLDGDATAILAGGATGGTACALATIVLVAPDAEAAIEPARAAINQSAEGGVSAWNGMLVARLIAAEGQTLRADVIRLIETLRGRPMPRVWTC